jgi:hypothetical protein
LQFVLHFDLHELLFALPTRLPPDVLHPGALLLDTQLLQRLWWLRRLVWLAWRLRLRRWLRRRLPESLPGVLQPAVPSQ